MARALVAILLIVVAIIHLIAATGVLGALRLETLYGVSIGDANVLILMQHRAVLFGIIGGLLFVSAFLPALQVSAIVCGLISTISFIMIAASEGGYSTELQRIVAVDLVAAALLIGAAAIRLFVPPEDPDDREDRHF